jgi:uncharacterized cupredoxin-like copper-binding protein
MRVRICAIAVLVAALLVTAAPAVALHSSAGTATVVRVTAGKPSEFRFTLSRKSVPLGTVKFVVTNRGKLPHDFKIAGKKTKLLSPGGSQTLAVKLTKAHGYGYLCTVAGHAAAGMRGTLRVVGSAKSAAGIHAAKKTTDVVTAGKPSEFRFTLSKKTVPYGTVTFRVTNKGTLPHDFKIAGKKTKLLSPGQSQTLKVTLKKGKKYPYLCTVTGHAAAGMKGTLKVT